MSIDSDVEAWMVLLAFLAAEQAPPEVYEACGWIQATAEDTREAADEARRRLRPDERPR